MHFNPSKLMWPCAHALLATLLNGCNDTDNAPTAAPSPVAQTAQAGHFDQTPEGQLAQPQKPIAGRPVLMRGAGATNGAQANAVFIDQLSPGETLTGLTVCADELINALTMHTNARTWPQRGRQAGTCNRVDLQPNEQIIRMTGLAYSSSNGSIRQLQFITSKGRTLGPWGTSSADAKPFSATIANGPNGLFKGFSGFTGSAWGGAILLSQLNLLDEQIGGQGGTPFVDRMKPLETVSSVTLCYRPDAFVQSIQLKTNLGDHPQYGSSWPGLPCNTTPLAANEYITQIFGNAGLYVDSLGYRTNLGRTVGPFGGTGGIPFQQNSDTGRFVGLFGRSGSWMDQVGLMTPAAGDLGWTFLDQMPPGQTASHVQVCTGTREAGDWVVKSLQTFYANGQKALPRAGGWPKAGDTCDRMALNPQEFITEAIGTHDEWDKQAITSIAFRTNQGRTFGPYGQGNGKHGFLIRNPNTSQFLGLMGAESGGWTKEKGFISGIDFASPDVLPKSAPPTAQATQMGWWDDLMAWPLIGIHNIVLADGSIMTYGTGKSGIVGAQFEYDIWSPWLGKGEAAHMTLPNKLSVDLFCSGQSLLPSGKVLMAGGDTRPWGNAGTGGGIKDTTLYDPAQKTLVKESGMSFGRWYASQVTLPSGRVLVSGGSDEQYRAVTTPEIYTPGQGWRQLPGMATSGTFAYYPRIFTTSWTRNGDQAYQITPDSNSSTEGKGKIFRLNPDVNNGQGAMVDTGVKLPGSFNWSNPTAQVAPNSVLVALEDGKTVLVNFPWREGDVPTVVPAGQMKQPRAWGNFTVLPTGDVLATNGSPTSQGVLEKASTYAELWDHATHTWRTLASEARPRLYHSTAVLLADGRVLSSGGGAGSMSLVTNINSQVFSPPYLFQGNGQASVRPTIKAAPKQLNAYRNQAFDIQTDQATNIARVTLVKLSSVTHSFNTEQRFIELPFKVKNGQTLAAQEPWDWYIAPPGYYMLTLINRQGVPSVSKVVQLQLQPSNAR